MTTQGWLQTNPWPDGSDRLPCIAVGRNRLFNTPITTNVPIPTGPLVPAIPHQVPGPQATRFSGIEQLDFCIDSENPALLNISIKFCPSDDDVGKILRLFNDKVYINAIPVDIINSVGQYPFSILDSSKKVFTISVNGAAKFTDWYTMNTLNINIMLSYANSNTVLSSVLYQKIKTFTKGPTPPPIQLTILNSGLARIKFLGVPGSFCTCTSACIPTGGLRIICKNRDFEIDTEINSSGNDISIFAFILEDANGNQTSVDIPIIRFAKPLRPFVTLKHPKPQRRVLVSIPLLSESFTALKNYIQGFQIERYVGSPSNISLVKDWYPHTNNVAANNIFYDYDLHSSKLYGYRVRYIGRHSDISEWSEWTTINIVRTSEDINIDDARFV